MASTSETGHSKNVANMDQLVFFALGYGDSYNPTKNALKTESLQTLSLNAKTAIGVVNDSLPVYSNAVAQHEEAFSSMSKLSTRILIIACYI